MSERLIVLAAGGTGGHMFPAEALARELTSRGLRVALLTDERGLAWSDTLPGIERYRVPAGRLGAGIAAKAVGLAGIAYGTLAAARLLRRLAPAAVVGFGGYPSVPTMLAATRSGMTTLIHEQNALLGRANRLLAPRAGRIATSFPEVSGIRPGDQKRVVETGNPVRPAVAAMRGMRYAPPDGAIHLLILGGSQGATILSEIVPAALALLPVELRARLQVTQQARSEDIDKVRRAYAESGITADLATFVTDVPARLARANLVISRSGASTVAELCVVGRPSILVPYLHAADDHQTFNARALERAGAAWTMPQPQFTAPALAERLRALLVAPAALTSAAAAAERLGRPDAARRLADLVVASIGSNGAHASSPRENAA